MNHSEGSITRLIREHFASNAYAVLSQVRNATGYARVTRTADAIVMSLWPSRGLTLSGFEIKVTKQDWKKELAQPEKAEEISRFCDRWYIAAPPGIVDVADLPPTWGLFEAGEKKLSLVREATIAKEVLPISRGFLGALLRAATTGVLPKSEVDEIVAARVDETVKNQLEWRVRDALPAIRQTEQKLALIESENKRLRSRIDTFEANSGIRLDEYQAGAIGKAVDAIRWQPRAGMVRRFEEQAESLRRAAELADEAAKELRAVVAADEPDKPTWGAEGSAAE